jgi:hypothetical protein
VWREPLEDFDFDFEAVDLDFDFVVDFGRELLVLEDEGVGFGASKA